MKRHCFKVIVFILTLAVGTNATSLTNTCADWFVEKYLTDPWMDPLPPELVPPNCDPLVLVLNNQGELYAGKEKLGEFEEVGKIETSALAKTLIEKFSIANERMRPCLATEVRHRYCASFALCLLTVDAKPQAIKSLTSALRAANLDFARLAVRHRFQRASTHTWYAVQNTTLVQTSFVDR